MMLRLGGGPSLPHERVHIGIHEAKKLSLVGQGRGVLPVIRKVSSDIVFLLLIKLNIVDEGSKLDELRNVRWREGSF
jgi:hypothetical protein